jgi:hypothetical protein
MGSPGVRAAAIAVVGVAAAVVLFVVLSGDDDDSPTTPTAATTTQAQTGGGGQSEPAEVPTIVIKDGQPEGGVQELTFTAGGDIRFDVKSDADWEIHFHGYNVMEDVRAGGEVSFDVPADIEGVFEVEIEDTATQIAQITVEPA